MSFTTALKCFHDNGVCTCKGGLSKLGTTSSPFTAAANGELETVVKYVEKFGRDVDKEDSGGFTMLHYAAQHDRTSVVEYLCKMRANVNSRSCGATPLHRAAFWGSHSSVKILVEAGADQGLRDTSRFGKSRTALHKAAEQGHMRVINFLLKCMSHSQVQILDAEGKSYLELLKDKESRVENHYYGCRANSEVSGDAVRIKTKSIQQSDKKYAVGIDCPKCGIKTVAVARNICCNTIVCRSCAKVACSICQKRCEKKEQ
mmetsp:Transcript_108/g.168  ORF Transcript_108/g.168 Transcript_108/m.168 type:complete len:259 (+) Transcript_108:592-1368(+)